MSCVRLRRILFIIWLTLHTHMAIAPGSLALSLGISFVLLCGNCSERGTLLSVSPDSINSHEASYLYPHTSVDNGPASFAKDRSG